MFQNITTHRREVNGGRKNEKVMFFQSATLSVDLIMQRKDWFDPLKFTGQNPWAILPREKRIQITVAFTLLLNVVQPQQCCSNSIPWILQNICIKINQENMKSSMCTKGDFKEAPATAMKKLNKTKLKGSVRAAEKCQNQVVCRWLCFFFFKDCQVFYPLRGSSR